MNLTPIDFMRWHRWQPWTCTGCGALTRHPEEHAEWHVNGRARVKTHYSERRPKVLTIHVGRR